MVWCWAVDMLFVNLGVDLEGGREGGLVRLEKGVCGEEVLGDWGGKEGLCCRIFIFVLIYVPIHHPGSDHANSFIHPSIQCPLPCYIHPHRTAPSTRCAETKRTNLSTSQTNTRPSKAKEMEQRRIKFWVSLL